ncbi:MAG TPA: VWA domain-containing protein, partial [Chthonomonadales bacterium]|nr:VWA domain-containing protein [Chthonomonadales bacterium]
EQTPSKSRQKRPQKIFRISEIETAGMNPPAAAPVDTVPGVYTNAVAAQKDPVPPTVLLVDGINTEIQYQAQVHVQMLRMLRQLPPNAPVAVFLMGPRLQMLQGFTTDPRLLQEALAKAYSVTGQGLGHRDPADDADAAGNQQYGLNDPSGSLRGLIGYIKGFDQMVYAANIQERFDRTNIAFLSIARSLAGYPGRKNVLWLSTSFPLTLNVFMNKDDVVSSNDRSYVNNWARIKILNNALSDAMVAVYPVDLGGVRNLQVYSAATRPANPYMSSVSDVDTQAVSGAAAREIDVMNNEQNAMHSIADDTGGKVCSGSNDLGKCVRDAMNDSSHFYEISYYPDSPEWNGEYRKISLSVKSHGAHLSYRQGYYATNETNPDPKVQQAEMQKDCGELLDATGIAFTARSQPADAPGQLKFSLEIDPSALTFTATPDGKQLLDVEVAVCTFDRKGWSQQLMAYPLRAGLDAKAYNTLITGGKLRDSIFVPGPKPAAVRLLVKDIPSGRLGSVYIQSEMDPSSKAAE